MRPIPPLDDPGMNLSRAGDHAVECCARNLAKAAAARRLAVTDETGRGAGGVDDPEGAGGRRRELDDQGERELGGDDRRQLGELLAAQRTTEDGEGRSLGRQAELVGRTCDRRPGLARLERVLQGDGDDRVAEEVESGALAPTVGQASRPHLRGA